jgi:Gpi18-like mannosyltransferase
LIENARSHINTAREQINKFTEPKKNQLIILVLFSLIPSFIIFFLNRNDLSVIFRYWDGPNYIEVAKTLYKVPVDHPFTPYGTTPAYFACHLPLYPLLIRIFSFMTYPVSMIFVTLLTAALATIAFYYFLLEYDCVKSPFYSALISTFLPARWLIYKSIGASEALFILLVLLSLIAYKRNKLPWAMVFASLSGITRITGILFALIYFIEFIRTKNYKAIPLLAIIGVPLLLTFTYYQVQYNDFFAYFSWNSKLIHSNPLDIYYAYTGNGDTHSSELYFLFYAIYGLGALLLWQYPVVFTYSMVFYCFNLFIFHEDLSRYFLCITPFALIVAYDKVLNTPQFKLFSIFVLYLGIIYAGQMLHFNVVDNNVYTKLLMQPSYP